MTKLILGTVQFGLNYGINNSKGKPKSEEVQNILSYAINSGIKTLDTADAYGDATALIGSFQAIAKNQFDIITKFKGFSDEAKLDDWINKTLDKLNTETLKACMFHSVEDYFTKPHFLEFLQNLYRKKLIENIGVSIYTNKQFEQIIEDPTIHLIQLPFNLLDNENLRGDLIKKAKEQGKTIHTRSVFLQGLFFMDLDNLPPNLKPLRKYLTILHTLCNDLGISMQALALGYAYRNPNIDGVIIGVDNLEQLKSNLKTLSFNLPQNVMDEVNSIIVSESELLNPVNWS